MAPVEWLLGVSSSGLLITLWLSVVEFCLALEGLLTNFSQVSDYADWIVCRLSNLLQWDTWLVMTWKLVCDNKMFDWRIIWQKFNTSLGCRYRNVLTKDFNWIIERDNNFLLLYSPIKQPPPCCLNHLNSFHASLCFLKSSCHLTQIMTPFGFSINKHSAGVVNETFRNSLETLETPQSAFHFTKILHMKVFGFWHWAVVDDVA